MKKRGLAASLLAFWAASGSVSAPALPSSAEAGPADAGASPSTSVPEAERSGAAGETRLFAAPGDFAGAVLDGVLPVPFVRGLFTLAPRADGSFPSSGTVVLPAVETERPFDELVASWNAELPPGTAVEVLAQVHAYGRWWDEWYPFGVWASSAPASVKFDAGVGFMDIDTLKLRATDQPAGAYRLKVVLTSRDGKAAPVLRLAAAAASSAGRPLLDESPFAPGPWVRDLPVPERSQMTEQAAFARDICSPTSLAMVMSFWGKEVATADAAREVFDHGSKRYGNWPFNAAFAASRGLAAHVARLPSMLALQDEVAAGRPVVASITFAAGELTGSPLASTRGHLLVVRGFTQSGDVIVNDPAAPDAATARRVYKRAEFRKAWLENKRGLAYLIRPRWPMDLVAAAAGDLRVEPMEGPATPEDRGRLTQLLPFERVRALDAKDGWARVEAVEQEKSIDGRWQGYPGWIAAAALASPPGRPPRPGIRAGREPALAAARVLLGRPYVWGGLPAPGSAAGVDCSGLVHLAHRAAGIAVPRDAQDQFLKAKRLERAAAPGDLVFVSAPGEPRRIVHVALYEGAETVIEAVESEGIVRRITFQERWGAPLPRLGSGKKVGGRTLWFGTFLDEKK